MTPWRTYADPPVVDPAIPVREQRRLGRVQREATSFADVLVLPGEQMPPTTGIVVPMIGISGALLPGGSAKPPLSGSFGPVSLDEGRAVLDVLDVDNALPGPWEWEVVALARDMGGRAAARAFGEGYQEAIGQIAEQPMHGVRGRAIALAGRLARGLTPATPAGAAARLVREGSAPRLRPERLAQRWGSRADPVVGIEREVAQYRETVAEGEATLLARYRIADALGAPDGRLMVLLDRGAPGDVLLIEAMPVGPSSLESQVGAWRSGSDVQRVLLARETMPLAPPELLGWSTSPDGAIARVWARPRALPSKQSPDLGSRRRRARAIGAIVGLVHASGGDASRLAGYLGRSARFPEALGDAVG